MAWTLDFTLFAAKLLLQQCLHLLGVAVAAILLPDGRRGLPATTEGEPATLLAAANFGAGIANFVMKKGKPVIRWPVTEKRSRTNGRAVRDYASLQRVGPGAASLDTPGNAAS